MQHFAALQRPSLQKTRSLRESQYRVPRKRPHHDDEDLDDEDLDDEDDETDDARDKPQRAVLPLPEDAAVVPSAPFPHGPDRLSKESLTPAQVQQTLAAQNPPLFAVETTSKNAPVGRKSHQASTLRQTHLDILTTVLHQCLLEGDYHRAGRAWGMILRTPISGIPFDPRFRGRWGISAELLLRQEPSPNGHGEQYSEGAFERAREYYERLIIQYPYRKGQTHATDALTFYPAMFSLWLYEICEQGKHARKQVNQRRKLKQAQELAERLDQLITSPPLDSHSHLLRLRGMIALWVADLILKQDSPIKDNIYQGEKDSGYNVKSTQERLDLLLESQRELERALVFFDKAHHHGEILLDTVRSVDLKMRDLSRRIAKLGG
ncbi:hypothetical protein K491DRAFT_608878 [Lophiostoma macrostomum CBS 122681]|uniref:Uncharacterized protein n=1 Tax=Lophiostoma macrostomum CBS 122681 TaxID=1314788 RepID=A0A6A6SRC8_9PLEO|nr:hypothetical protein K491DRAFT_608878 [Lophiostoma macrostomum CBS 122681]